MKKDSSGFTLVELSIVLIIIGLVVGGVLAGSDLIKVAEVQKFIKQKNSIDEAINTYRTKYNAIPGDHRTATLYFPSCTDATNDTCNGDGDGFVEAQGINTFTNYEDKRFWEHLISASFVSGDTVNAPGLDQHGALLAEIGNNAYFRAQFAEQILGLDIGTDCALCWAKRTGNILVYRLNGSGKALSPENAFYIDEKIDDGRPKDGVIYAWQLGGTECHTVAFEYNLDLDENRCFLTIQF